MPSSAWKKKNAALNAANSHLTETLDQQTATSEILNVIANWPSGVQAVVDAIVKSAAKLVDPCIVYLCSPEDAQLVLPLHDALPILVGLHEGGAGGVGARRRRGEADRLRQFDHRL